MTKYTKGFVFGLLTLVFSATSAQSFASRQDNFSRVNGAKLKTEGKIKKLFKDSGMLGVRYIYWRAFKKEQKLELWASDSSSSTYRLIKTYPICKGSGDLGPKRKFGDLQVPEGCYYISRYNPTSNYHLSMKVSYPNESDVIKGDKDNPGNEIFIHGACASVGCLPMTDSTIDEIYWVTVMSQSYQGSMVKIPIDVFPCEFTKSNWDYLKRTYKRKSLQDFWENLEGGYSFFEKTKIPPGYWVDQQGEYHFLYPQNYHINDKNH